MSSAISRDGEVVVVAHVLGHERHLPGQAHPVPGDGSGRVETSDTGGLMLRVAPGLYDEAVERLVAYYKQLVPDLMDGF